MSDESSDLQHSQPVNGGVLKKAVDILTTTQPAKLFLMGAAALVLTGLCTYASIRLQSGSGAIPIDWFSNPRSYSVPTRIDEPYSRVKQFSGFLLSITAFILGILGGLLPMWAVGRLIADAVQTTGSREDTE